MAEYISHSDEKLFLDIIWRLCYTIVKGIEHPIEDTFR